mmetsp:Transcript_13850/g.44332  ORF Transcript_13850/g.44332 Transcript_13850/m.44332 type:complete len:203 (-) Transcript_13850:358-966(-)
MAARRKCLPFRWLRCEGQLRCPRRQARPPWWTASGRKQRRNKPEPRRPQRAASTLRMLLQTPRRRRRSAPAGWRTASRPGRPVLQVAELSRALRRVRRPRHRVGAAMRGSSKGWRWTPRWRRRGTLEGRAAEVRRWRRTPSPQQHRPLPRLPGSSVAARRVRPARMDLRARLGAAARWARRARRLPPTRSRLEHARRAACAQ